ncbi:MAG: hypothetical protein KDA65_05800 [Planctomycetaceae bacterium]|nr:hypothetical protein [Planctomycetaceae bacterium]
MNIHPNISNPMMFAEQGKIFANSLRLLLSMFITLLFLTETEVAQADNADAGNKKPVMIRLPHSALGELDLEAQSVFLNLDEFRELWQKAQANADADRQPVLTEAQYAAKLDEKLLRINGTYKLQSYNTQWQFIKLPLRNMAVVSASINDQPALLGHSADGPLLFLKEAGKLTLNIEYAVPVRPSGSDQVINFSLPPVPSGTFQLTLPEGKQLLVNTQSLSSEDSAEGQKVFSFPIGNQPDWTFRITEKNNDTKQDRLFLASSNFTVFSKAAEISWKANTQLEVYGQPLDIITCTVPNHLEVMSVTSTGLDSWELTEDPLNPQRTQIKLNYRQGITGKRDVSIEGVTTADTEGRWLFPNLIINSADSQWGEISLGFVAPWKVHVETMEGVRRKSYPGEMTSTPSRFGRALYFDIWRPDFELRLQNETSKSSYHAALASVVSIEEQEVVLQSQLTLEAVGAELFNFEFTLPANWEIESIQAGETPLDWKTLMSEPGQQRIQVPLNSVLLPGGTTTLNLKANLVDWILTEENTIELPQVNLSQADLVEGTLVIQAVDRFNVQHLNSEALEPIILGLTNERLSYRFHEGKYSGEISVKSKPALVVAQTTSLAKLEKKELITRHEVLLDIANAPIHSLIITVTHLEDNQLQFLLPRSNVRVTAELLGEGDKPEASADQSHTWRLGFSQPLQGEHLLYFETRHPRAGEKTSFNLPELRFDHVNRQYGTLLVEAEPEQRIATTALDSLNQPLPEQRTANISLFMVQLQSRLVEAFSYVRKGYQWSLSEEKFDRSNLPVAICDQTNISSLLTSTGEFQHQATYKFRTANTQSLLLQFPEQNVELWSSLLNEEPVPVRKSEQGFHISLPVDKDPGAEQKLRILYSRPIAESESTSQVAETPPRLYVVDGAGGSHDVIMINQNWHLSYPREKTIVESDGDFHPETSLETWRSRLLNGSLQYLKTDFWWRGLMLLGFLVALNVLIIVTRLLATNWKKTLIVGCLFIALGGLALVVTTMDTGVRFTGVRDEIAYRADHEPGAENRDWNSPEMYERKLKYLKSLAQGNDPRKKQRAITTLNNMLGVEETERFLSDLDERWSYGAIPESLGEDADVDLSLPEMSIATTEPQLENEAPLLGAEDMEEADGVMFDSSAAAVQQAAPQRKRQSRLSISMNLPVSSDMNQEEFEYYGSGQGSLRLVLRDQQHDQTVTFCLFAAVLLLFWSFHRLSLGVFCKYITLAVFIPLALLWILPAVWFPWLAGTMFGALAALILKLVSLLTTWCCGHCCLPAGKKVVATGALFLMILMGQNLYAQNEGSRQRPTPNQELQQQANEPAQPQPAIEPAVEPPRKPIPPVNILKQPNSYLFLYEDDYQQSSTVILRPEQYRKLWQQAYQSAPGGQQTFPEPIVASAGYTGSLTESDGKESFTLTGKIVVFAFGENPARLQLPFKNMTLNSATINGQPAELESKLDNEEQLYWVHLQQAGMQIIEVELQIPLKQQNESGQFSVHLLPVAAGLLSITFPGEDLQVSAAGTFLPYRQEQQDSNLLIEQPISSGGDLEFKWQPKSSREDSSAIVHAESVVDIQLTETGAQLTNRSTVRVRRGTINQVTFALPEGTKVREIKGSDVGGWSIQEEEGRPQLQILFRRSITGSTDLNVELYQPISQGEAEGTLNIDRLGLLNLNRSIGTIAIHAPQHLSLKTNKLENLSQINPSDLPQTHQNSTGQKLAFRYHSVPYSVSLSVWQKKTTTGVETKHALFVERQSIQYSSRFDIQLTGEPLLHLEFDLPENYLPMEVLANQLDDWYIEREANQAPRLILEFTEPQQNQVQVAVSGKILKEIDSQEVSLTFPQTVGMDRVNIQAGIWFSEYYTPRLKEQGDWKTEATSQLHSSILERHNTAPRFGFRSPRGTSTPILFDIMRTQAQMTANAVTLTNISDTSLAYTLALKWSITHGGADQFVFTVPKWLQGKLELNGTGIRQAVESEASEDRVRWTVETQRLQQQEYFITALATLELPADGVFEIPVVEFERIQKQENETRFVPFELSQNDSIVVNQSLAHVKQKSGLSSPIDASSLPINIENRFLDQAIAIQRLNLASDEPQTWEISWSQQFKSASAQILLADIVTTIAYDGSVRGKVTYSMRNNSRQHLAVEIPESARLLSILVGGKPARAVEAQVNGTPVKLIPLPKQSEFGLSYPIEVAFESKPVTNGFLHDFQIFARRIEMPVPLVIELAQSPEWGIPVLHTKWTVYAPENYEIDHETGVDQSNLSISYDAERATKLATLEEARMYLKSMKQKASFSNASSESYGYKKGLEQLQSRLSEVQSFNRTGGRLSSKEERARQELSQDLKEIQQEVQTELSRQQAVPQAEDKPLEHLSRDNTQRDYLLKMNQALIGGNSLNGVQLDDKGEMNGEQGQLQSQFGLTLKEGKDDISRDKAGEGKEQSAPSKPSNTRGEQSGRSYSNVLELSKTRLGGMNKQSAEPAEELEMIQENNSQLKVDPYSMNRVLPPQTEASDESAILGDSLNLAPLDNWPSSGTIVGLSQPGTFQQSQNGQSNLDFVTNVQTGQTMIAGLPAIQLSSRSTTLSLPVRIPNAGQQLEFLKVGGRPRLILTARSERIWTTLLSLLFAVVALLAAWICYQYLINRKKFGTGIILLLYLLGVLSVLLGSFEFLILGFCLLIAGLIFHLILRMSVRFKQAVN